jgi:hypothetical protein
MKLFKKVLISCVAFSFLFGGSSFAERRRKKPTPPQRALIRTRSISEPTKQTDYSRGIKFSMDVPWKAIQNVVGANGNLKQRVYQDAQVRRALVEALLKTEYVGNEESAETNRSLIKSLLSDPEKLEEKMQLVLADEAVRIAIGNAVSRIAAEDKNVNNELMNDVLSVVKQEKTPIRRAEEEPKQVLESTEVEPESEVLPVKERVAEEPVVARKWWQRFLQ